MQWRFSHILLRNKLYRLCFFICMILTLTVYTLFDTREMENTSGQNLIDSRDLYNPQTDHLRFRRSTDQKPQCDTNKESSDQESPCPYNMIVTHNSVMWPPYIMEKVCDPTRRPLCTSKCEQNKVAVQPIRRRSRLLGCRNENSSEICYYRKEEEHIKNYCSCI